MWAGIGGSAVHRMTEDIDRAAWGQDVTVGTWDDYWAEAFDDAKERNPEFEPEDYYCSGRASKEWPNKENPDWWAKKGPEFVRSWVTWREHNDFKVWECPDLNGELQPGIELEVMAYPPEGYDCVPVRSILDRVMEAPDGSLRIVDLKAGSYTQPWPLQLALNNLGLVSLFDVRATHGGFWKARDGGIKEWHELSLADEWLWDQVASAQTIRDNQLFLASPNNLCANACGVRAHCPAVGGTPFFPVNATVTHNQEKA